MDCVVRSGVVVCNLHKLRIKVPCFLKLPTLSLNPELQKARFQKVQGTYFFLSGKLLFNKGVAILQNVITRKVELKQTMLQTGSIQQSSFQLSVSYFILKGHFDRSNFEKISKKARLFSSKAYQEDQRIALPQQTI